MKVRHKQADYVVEYDVVEESSNYYIVKHPHDPNSHVCLQKRIYGPHEEPRWQDVTGECYEGEGTLKGCWQYKRPESIEKSGIFTASIVDCLVPNLEPKGYRLILNRIWEDGEAGFKVERKVHD